LAARPEVAQVFRNCARLTVIAVAERAVEVVAAILGVRNVIAATVIKALAGLDGDGRRNGDEDEGKELHGE
jgi:hypothetical protein